MGLRWQALPVQRRHFNMLAFSLKDVSHRRSVSILPSRPAAAGPLAFLSIASVIRCFRSSSLRCASRSVSSAERKSWCSEMSFRLSSAARIRSSSPFRRVISCSITLTSCRSLGCFSPPMLDSLALSFWSF